MTKLGIARIVGECSLTGGCITGGTYAVKYSKEIIVVTKDKDDAEQAKKRAESERDEAASQKSNYSNGIHGLGMIQWKINSYVLQKLSNETDNELKEKLVKFNECLNHYLYDDNQKDCLRNGEQINDYGLGDRLTHLGISFS